MTLHCVLIRCITQYTTQDKPLICSKFPREDSAVDALQLPARHHQHSAQIHLLPIFSSRASKQERNESEWRAPWCRPSPSFCSCSPVGREPRHRQRGSVAGLTFPFSCSQRTAARPIHPNRVPLFEWLWGGALGRRRGRAAAGWMVPGWALERGVRTTARGRGICVMSVQTREQRFPHLRSSRRRREGGATTWPGA